ncbi:MAG: ABC transporter permease subunit [Candidatus Latescibacteria bacterium]|jgi:NitT/TauT family transport system permease protein|nr:ABC transporter permease subunit [Candidatus Latescibacterota bacterium]MBT5829859.1 ABC transporter permease subunit [Candidatus Latescibacterota bacterium]
MNPHTKWFAIRQELPKKRSILLGILAFLLPLAIWSAVSYVPGMWHPMVRVSDVGHVDYFQVGMLVEREVFDDENKYMQEAGKKQAIGEPSNPIYLPAPHIVVKALITAFQTEPIRRGEPWLHESIFHSVQVIFYGFMLSAIFGVPLGILCGTFAFFSRIIEPFVDFIRYMPAPAFGALMVAFLGINDAPKVAIIFIGTFFQMVLVVGNTTRQLDGALIEAAQTLGANAKNIVSHVIIPGIVPNLYRDMRILLGWAWTYLIVAELIGASSGISWFINQQAKYRNYENVFAAIIIIGIIGLSTDIFLSWIGKHIFPWENRSKSSIFVRITQFIKMQSAKLREQSANAS